MDLPLASSRTMLEIRNSEPLPAWALDLARQAVVLRAERKHCMLTVKFDGLAWQLYESHPVKRGGG